MGPTGAPQPLGGATFTLAVNQQPFTQGLIQAQQQAQNISNKIGQSFGRGGGASMGLLYLGQAIDDVQYGFRAIVNNIPQIVMGLGGGAGLAGAVGIAAVAVNQLSQHWDEISGKLQNTAPFLTMAGAANQFTEAVLKQDSALEKWLKTTTAFAPMLHMIKEFMAFEAVGSKIAAAQVARMAASGKAGEKIGEIKSKEAQGRAKDFKDALEAYGGGAKLIKDVVDAQMKLTPGADRAMMQTRAVEMITKGLAGEDVNKKFFGEGFGRNLANVQAQKNLKEEEKFIKNRMEAQKQREREETEMLNKEGEGNAGVLEMQRDKAIKDLEHQEKMIKAQEDFLHKSIRETSPSQIFTSGHALASHMMTGALDSLGKEQVKQLQALNEKMTKLREEMAKQRGMRFR